MKNFVEPLPTNLDSAVDTFADNMNSIVNALVEIRSAVPDSPEDINAISMQSYETLYNRVVALESAVAKLESPTTGIVPPSAPAISSVVAGDTTATVYFTAPIVNGGSAVTKYVLRSSSGRSVEGTSSPITMTGLTNGSAVTFTISAVNAAGTGTPSSESTSVTPTNTAKPTVPTNVKVVVGDGTLTLSWGVPASDGGSPVTGYRIARDGVDTTGYGIYTADLAATARSQMFTALVNGSTYNLTVAAINANGVGPLVTISGKPVGSTTTPTNPTPGNSNGVLPAVPARGWYSGGSGHGIDKNNPAFGNWRGQPIDALSTWLDGLNGSQWGNGLMGTGSTVSDNAAYRFKGLVDIAIGGPSRSNFAAAANGSLDNQLRTAMRNMRNNRTIDGVLYPTIVRPCHEFNGNYGWEAQKGDEANFKAFMKRWRNIGKQEFPEVIWAFCPNGESYANFAASGARVADFYEAGVYDIIGTDRYNQYPHIGTSTNGIFTSWDAAATQGSDANPKGFETWRLFALNRGLPLYIPEYANNAYDSGTPSNAGDDPYYITQLFAWIQKHKGNTAGKVFAEMWFNQFKEENRWHIYSTDTNNPTRQPKVAAGYRSYFQSL